MSEVILQYFYPVFLAVLGTLQIASAYNRLWGLCLFRRPISAYIFAALLIGPSGYLLFTWNQRNPYGVIEGPEQALFFFLGALCALLLTIVAASLINAHRLQAHKPREKGLNALREVTFFQAIRYGWRGRR